MASSADQRNPDGDTPVEISHTAFVMIPVWVFTAPGIHQLAPQVYGALWSFASHGDRSCWPSLAKIAERARTSVDTVERCVKDLARIGAVEVETRFAPDRGRASNHYQLRFDPPPTAVSGSPLPLSAEAPTAVSGSNQNQKNQNQGNQKKNIAGSHSSPAQDQQLSVIESPKEAPDGATVAIKDETKGAAQRIARDWYDWRKRETGHPPTQPVIAVVKIVESLLRAGWGESQIRVAMGRCGSSVVKWRVEERLAELVGAPLAATPRPSTTDQRLMENQARIDAAVARYHQEEEQKAVEAPPDWSHVVYTGDIRH